MISIPAACSARIALLEPDHARFAEIARLRREEGEGGVAPVVAQPLLDEEAVVGEGVDRHQLDGSDAELDEVVDHGRMTKGREGAAQLGRHRRVQGREALDVRLVEDRVAPWPLRRPIVTPGVGWSVDDAFRHHRRAVAPVRSQVAAVRSRTIAEQGVVPADAAVQAPGIGIEEQLVRVEAVPAPRLVGAVHAIAVELSRLQAGDIAVPDLIRPLRQGEPLDLPAPLRIEQAEFDRRRMCGEEREVDALAVPYRPEGRRAPVADPACAHPLISRQLSVIHQTHARGR